MFDYLPRHKWAHDLCILCSISKSNYICPQSSRAVYWKHDNNEQKNKSRYQSLPTAHFESRGFLSCSFELIEKRIVISILFFSVYSKDLELLLVLNNFRSRYSILSLTVRTLQHAPQNSFATSKTVLIMCLIHCKQTRN